MILEGEKKVFNDVIFNFGDVREKKFRPLYNWFDTQMKLSFRPKKKYRF